MTEENRGPQMLGLVLILIPVSIFWLVVGFALGFWIGVT